MRQAGPGLDLAVQVCEHIANEGKPILWGRRNEADGVEDSGWQFRCAGDTVESPTGFRFWSVSEILNEDPAICLIINCPHGSIVQRAGSDEDWRVSGAERIRKTGS